MEQLRQEKLEIDQQLRSIHGTTLGSMQSLQLGRRNDRGYNSDMDGGGRAGRGGSMRGGRGGRGRGGGGGPGGRQNDRYNSGTSNNSTIINDFNVNNINDSKKFKQHSIGNNSSRGRGQQPRGGGNNRTFNNNINKTRQPSTTIIDSAGNGEQNEKK